MQTSRFPLVSTLLTLAATVLPPAGHAADPVYTISNPYTEVNWETDGVYKGSFHNHTTQSDGRHTPAELIDDYKALGYDVLSITDHNRVTYPWTAHGRDPAEVGMTDIVGNELSSGHHIVSLFSTYASTSTNEDTLLAGVAAAGGLSFFAHPGRYTREPQWYADHFLTYASCIGMEIHNQGDRFKNDRVKWDEVLTLLMPDRPVWGFSMDDTHAVTHVGRNRTYLLAPSSTHSHIRLSLERGAFFSTYSTSSTHTPPMITGIAVDETAGTITLSATGHTEIRWIAQGVQVATGETLDLVAHAVPVPGYVRAELHGPEGITYTNPFGVREFGIRRQNDKYLP